jgi:hypothetical protein
MIIILLESSLEEEVCEAGKDFFSRGPFLLEETEPNDFGHKFALQ